MFHTNYNFFEERRTTEWRRLQNSPDAISLKDTHLPYFVDLTQIHAEKNLENVKIN